MFGFCSFQHKNVRRKEDARDYPSRIEFGIKQGFALPLARMAVAHEIHERLFARMAKPYASQTPGSYSPLCGIVISSRTVAGWRDRNV